MYLSFLYIIYFRNTQLQYVHLGFITRNEISSNGQCKYDISSLDANLQHDFEQKC